MIGKMWSGRFSKISKYNIIKSKLLGGKRWTSSEASKRVAALWGNGDYGRLGLGSLESQWRPVVCSGFHNQSLKAIACGGAHTLFLTGSTFNWLEVS